MDPLNFEFWRIDFTSHSPQAQSIQPPNFKKMDRLGYINHSIHFSPALAPTPLPLRTPEQNDRINVKLTVWTLIIVAIILGFIFSFHFDPLEVIVIAIISLAGALLFFFLYRCCCVRVPRANDTLQVHENRDGSDNSANYDGDDVVVVTRQQQLGQPLLPESSSSSSSSVSVATHISPPLRVTMDVLVI